MKKSFLIYQDWEETFKNLTDAQSGKILMAMFAHAKGDKVELNRSLSLVFIPIRQQMDRNLESYEKISNVRRTSAYKRWKQPQEDANGMQNMQMHANAYDKDKVKDKDKDIYTDSKTTKTPSSYKETQDTYSNNESMSEVSLKQINSTSAGLDPETKKRIYQELKKL